MSQRLTKENGRYVAIILVERDKGQAYGEALKIKNDYPNNINYRLIGKAQSANPRALGRKSMVSGLNPGSSVGHIRGYPGTLGCLVKSTEEEQDWIGFTSCSHVLSINNTAQGNDIIIMPGHPDKPKVSTHKIGVIDRFIYLTHYSDEPGINVLNCSDVALVKIEPGRKGVKIPKTNQLVDPEDQIKRIELKGSLNREESVYRLGELVFKVGRSTDFTEGVLDIVGLQSQAIQLPDRKLYVYTDVLGVQWINNKPFSQHGDSGALVYTKDGYALGFVIGASEGLTFVSPIVNCLEDIRAELIL
ncbi:MAG: hypothetical protein AB4426_07500 [Xenococcaceae cyanobacterium]